MSTTEILTKLRALMKDTKHVKKPIQAYIVPTDDAHQSENVSERDKRREFISKFTGSAGFAIVTENQALLWTDGRYYLQAEKQLDKNWTLMKAGQPGVQRLNEWLSTNLKSGDIVGFDPMLMPYNEAVALQSVLESHGISAVGVDTNLVDIVWTDRPPLPEGMIWPLSLKYSGKSCSEKVQDLRKEMCQKDIGALILSSLDEIAWVLNLRGFDIPCSPFFYSYLIIDHDLVYLFANKKRMDCSVLSHFNSEHLDVKICSYENVLCKLEELIPKIKCKIWISDFSSYALVNAIPKDKLYIDFSPVYTTKVVKNPVEAEGMVNAHIKDGVAVCKFFAWLCKEVPKGTVDELNACEKIDALRRLVQSDFDYSEQEDFISLSFENISASGPNASFIHYQSTPETNRKLSTKEMYMIDSGGQYKDGTTDITRTLHFGEASDEEMEMYTRVLKGQLAVRMAVFPLGIKGFRFESWSRRYLWEIGYDYMHSLGHGVGMCLGVHEMPTGIMSREIPGDVGLEPNQFTSIEPGVYIDNKFGIRIEDVARVVPAKVRGDFLGVGALTFKTVSLVPLERRLINMKMLSQDEIKYINEYHQEVRDVIGPIIKKEGTKEEYAWLEHATDPLGCSCP